MRAVSSRYLTDLTSFPIQLTWMEVGQEKHRRLFLLPKKMLVKHPKCFMQQHVFANQSATNTSLYQSRVPLIQNLLKPITNGCKKCYSVNICAAHINYRRQIVLVALLTSLLIVGQQQMWMCKLQFENQTRIAHQRLIDTLEISSRSSFDSCNIVVLTDISLKSLDYGSLNPRIPASLGEQVVHLPPVQSDPLSNFRQISQLGHEVGQQPQPPFLVQHQLFRPHAAHSLYVVPTIILSKAKERFHPTSIFKGKLAQVSLSSAPSSATHGDAGPVSSEGNLVLCALVRAAILPLCEVRPLQFSIPHFSPSWQSDGLWQPPF